MQTHPINNIAMQLIKDWLSTDVVSSSKDHLVLKLCIQEQAFLSSNHQNNTPKWLHSLNIPSLLLNTRRKVKKITVVCMNDNAFLTDSEKMLLYLKYYHLMLKKCKNII